MTQGGRAEYFCIYVLSLLLPRVVSSLSLGPEWKSTDISTEDVDLSIWGAQGSNRTATVPTAVAHLETTTSGPEGRKAVIVTHEEEQGPHEDIFGNFEALYASLPKYTYDPQNADRLAVSYYAERGWNLSTTMLVVTNPPLCSRPPGRAGF